MKKLFAGLFGLLLTVPLCAAQETKTVPAGTPVTITVTPGTAPPPPVSIVLNGRHGHVKPTRKGFAHLGGGNIDIQQPSPDVVVITMTGVAVAGGHPISDSVATMVFELEQCFDVSFDDPKVKRAKLTLEGRVIGLLRSENAHSCKHCGTAEHGDGHVSVGCSGAEIVALCVPPHSVACGENLSINCREGPVTGGIAAGPHTLHATWSIQAAHPRGLGKAASADFADGALDPLWISYREPFHGAAKKDFGFQITVKVADDTASNGAAAPAANGEKK